jgi:hypothetical protein
MTIVMRAQMLSQGSSSALPAGSHPSEREQPPQPQQQLLQPEPAARERSTSRISGDPSGHMPSSNDLGTPLLVARTASPTAAHRCRAQVDELSEQHATHRRARSTKLARFEASCQGTCGLCRADRRRRGFRRPRRYYREGMAFGWLLGSLLPFLGACRWLAFAAF